MFTLLHCIAMFLFNMGHSKD